MGIGSRSRLNYGGGFVVAIYWALECPQRSDSVALRAMETELNAGGKRERFAVSAECYLSFLTQTKTTFGKK